MKNRIGSLFVLILLALMFKADVASAYYDPELGRFIQPDTIIPDLSNPQSYNRYSYVLNNPLRYTDPDGHEPGDLFTDQPMMTSADAVAMSKYAAPIMVGGTVAVVTGGAAAPLLAGAGASAGFTAVGAGIVGGVTGDLAAQGTQIGLGTRSSISGQEVAVSGLTGAAIGGATAGVGKILSVKGVPKVAPEASADPKTLISRQGPSEMTGNNIKRLTKSMKENGFDPSHPIEVANADGKLIILDGHHRTAAAIKAGIQQVPIKTTQVTAEKAKQLTIQAADAAAERSQLH